MKKTLSFCIIVLCLAGIRLFAQDSFFDNADFEQSNTDNADTESGRVPEEKKKFDLSGLAKTAIRFYPHAELKRAEANPVFGIDLKYTAAKTELLSSFRFNMRTVAEYPLDLIDECTVRAYLGDFVLSAGKMKIVWGRCDMLHVLDVFNANDFTDFTIPSYIDRRIGEPMVHVAYNAPIPLRVEGVWTPMMTPDRLALKGAWVPSQIGELKRNAADLLHAAISNTRFSRFFTEQTIQQMLHDPIAEELQGAHIPSSITIDMKNIIEKLDTEALLQGISGFAKPTIKKLLENLAKQKLTFSVTEIANTILPPKPDGSPYTDAEIEAMLAGEPFLTEFTARIAKEIVKTGKKAEGELIADLKDAGAIIESFQLDEVTKIGMNAMLPDMHKIEYGQCGIRLSGSASSVDMACQYYYGHYKTPSFNIAGIFANTLAGQSIKDCIYYDPVHIFGADVGAVIAMFNIKSEFAYYMTYDFKGTNPAVHNNSFRWVLGFDVGIPLNNINVNIQNIGQYTLGFKNVQKNAAEYFDMDWDAAGKSTNNKIVINLSDSWLHERLKDSVTVIWGIEHNDAVIMPHLRYKIKDELYVEGIGAYIYAKDKKSEFSSWKNNHFMQVSFEYKF